MNVQQISVYLENTPGRLAQFTRVLKDNKIDLKAMTVADTVDFGVVRCIVKDPAGTEKILEQNGFNAGIIEVLALEVEDVPGGLDAALGALADAGISVNYAYSVVQSQEGRAVIILKVKEPEEAAKVLKTAGITLYSLDALV